MKILAIEKDLEGVDWSNSNILLEEESREVYKQYLQGFIREIYFTENKNAVLILECESKQEAYEILNIMPLVTKGLTRFELMELKPYSGFDRIIKK